MAIFALRDPKGHLSAGRSASSVAKQSATTPNAAPAKTKKSSHSAHASTSHSTDVQGGSSVKSVPLIVLNNTTIAGLASRAAKDFESGGWTVTRSDNYQNEILSTCAYYDPADPHAKAAAEALQVQYPAIKRVKPKFPELPSGPVVVVLTPDYSTG